MTTPPSRSLTMTQDTIWGLTTRNPIDPHYFFFCAQSEQQPLSTSASCGKPSQQSTRPPLSLQRVSLVTNWIFLSLNLLLTPLHEEDFPSSALPVKDPNLFLGLHLVLRVKAPSVLLAACRDGFDGVQLIFLSTVLHILSLDSCSSGHPSIALYGILMDLYLGMGDELM
ncbi:hypothetical protein DSO57_1038471 [Entomophthora muscae]|uniref:Uncharacterized protein n=1 Tax=Entomophthora muscae TaxID=34485 RepID=A0ACC2SMZ2_9FUNG|nr:hypothetical protein DSO57_1038471 [Entomophthora muscae]